MKALLLAAGMGTRLRPITNNIPKCLVSINGKPLLAFWLEMLVEAGIHEIAINTHYFFETVERFIDSSPLKKYTHLMYEEKLLGTGGTLLKNKDFFEAGSVILVHADNLSKFDVNSFIKRHNERPAGTDITMMTFITDAPQNSGILELDDRGVVVGFYEKVLNPPGNIANGAVYIIEHNVIDFLSTLGKSQIDFSTEVLPHYMGRIFTFENTIYHRDIGTVESYERALVDFR